MMRHIAVVTTSRADYGHLYWPLKELESLADVQVTLIVMGPHLSPAFGDTIAEIEQDGFTVDERIECLLSSDTDIGMAKTIGLATLSLADTLGRLRPDLMLLIADRYEMLAPAAVALALRIPIAHIEGGEVSEGAIDDAVRNALTKMSHIHLTTTENARLRVIALGEEPWRVHRVGSPSLDHLVRQKLLARGEIESELGIMVDPASLLVTYHPVTIGHDTTADAKALFDALERTERQIIFCYPNADAGSYHLISLVKAFCKKHSRAQLFVNLGQVKYWSLLHLVGAVVGNSSSGIMETPSLKLPAVNVGPRQKGRERARNVLDCEAQTEAILKTIELAFSREFRESLAGMTNPYGDGHAAKRIATILGTVKLGPELLTKKAMTLPFGVEG